MFYEWSIAWKTIRKEGLGSLFNKLQIYFGDLASAREFSYDTATGEAEAGGGHPIHLGGRKAD